MRITLLASLISAATLISANTFAGDTSSFDKVMEQAKAAQSDQAWTEAQAYYWQAIQLDPNAAEAHDMYMFVSGLAAIYGVDQELPEEEQDAAKIAAGEANKEYLKELYQGWAEEDPNAAVYQWALGQQYMYKDYGKVESYSKRAIELDPGFSKAYQTLALIAEVRGNNALQNEYLAKAVEATPDSPDYAFYYVMSNRRGDRSRYVPETLAMIERFPGEERSAQALYWLAAESEDKADRIAYLERLKKEFPPAEFSWSANGMTTLVDLYTETDQQKALDLANEELEHADPDYHGGYLVKMWTDKVEFVEALIESNRLMDEGDFTAAAEIMEGIETPKRGHADVLHATRARALHGAGRTDEAYTGLLEVAATSPTDVVYEATFQYGARLGKSEQQITGEIQSALTAKAEPLKDFSFERYDTGETVSLSDFHGKVVLMNFWYPFCGPCRGENPYLQKTLEKYAHDFVILAINVHPEEDEFVMPYTRGNNFDFIPLKSDMEFAQKEFQARGMPTNFLLDVEGNKVLRLPPVHGDEVRTLELQIESLLPAKTPESLMKQAEARQSEQDWGGAADLYLQAINLDPTNAEAHSGYKLNVENAVIFGDQDPELSEEEQDEAMTLAMDEVKAGLKAQYEAWANEDPENAAYQWALGQLYMYEDYDRVESYSLRAIELDPGLSAAYKTMALISEVRGDNALQSEYLAKAAEASPDDPGYAFYYVMSLRRSDRSRYVSESLAMIDRFPGENRAAQALYWLANESPDKADRIAYLERLKEEFPPEEVSWSSNGMGKLVDLYTETNPQAALELAKEQLELADPEYYGGYMVKMWTDKVSFIEALIDSNRLMDKGDFAAAAETMEDIEPPKRGHADVLHATRGRALDGAGRTEEAYAGLLEIAATNPTDVVYEATFNYGAKLGKTEQQIVGEINAILTGKAESLKDFSFERYDTGETVSLSDFHGKVVLMNFWYPFCGPCRGENPYLQKTLEKYADDFVILAINVHPEEDEFVMPYTRGNNFDFIPLKSDMEFAQKEFQARGMPTNFLLDAKGNKVLRLPPVHGDEVRTLELQIESLLPADEA